MTQALLETTAGNKAVCDLGALCGMHVANANVVLTATQFC